MLRIAATSVAALWITVLGAGGQQSEKSMTAHFIEVGQGHASLLEFPCGAILVDAGAAGAADNRLVEYLDDFFADRPDLHRTLDLVLITHNHIDHTQALMKVATRFQVKRFIDNGWVTGSGARRATPPRDPKLLDRYERLVEATRLVGREQEAFDLFVYGMRTGGLTHFELEPGEYQRGYRILTSFSATGQPEDLGRSMDVTDRYRLALAVGGYAEALGRLEEAHAIYQFAVALRPPAGTWSGDSFPGAKAPLRRVKFALGRLREARALDGTSLAAALLPVETAKEEWDRRFSRNLNLSTFMASYDADLARKALAECTYPGPHIESLRTWTARSSEMALMIEAHLLSARHLLASGDTESALGEAETGLLHAVTCGYGLLRIELLVALARIWLAWPDPPKAIQAAREALDLATHPDCRYRWGEADAAQVWGEAYFANHEPELARRAFTQALAVRKRIEHPGVAETEKWLAMAGA